MTAKLNKLCEQVKALPPKEREAFLSWVADFEAQCGDDWDKEIERDARPGGRLKHVLARARRDIAAGRTKPLDELLNNR
jgi:hypothetical protein